MLSLSLALLAFVTHVQSSFQPIKPPSIPLAVRSPYLSTWLPAGSGGSGNLAGQWPAFWSGATTGWTGMVRVDGTTYTWLGNPGTTLAQQTAFSYTSTRSIFTFNVAGKIGLNVTFLSPVEPKDLMRSSLPVSYMEVDVFSIDGSGHTVALYTDVSAEWISGDRNAMAQWNHSVIDNVAYHQFYRQNQILFGETGDQADYGVWYYAADYSYGSSFQSGSDQAVRQQFINNGYLADSQDTNFRPINQDYPVFGFAVYMGTVTTSQSALFQLSHHQPNAVQFLDVQGVQSLPSLWTTFFDSDSDAIQFFYNDYGNAQSHANDLDRQIAEDSVSAGGQNYLTITSLAIRQAFGGLVWTNTQSAPLVFLKEMSSGDDVNTVDVIYPFHPMAMYLNSTIIKYLLDPLYINQEAGHWPNAWAMHDLAGYSASNRFPNATGHTDGNDEQLPLETTADMIILTLAYAQNSNDDAYLIQHYYLLKQWADYLVHNSLTPDDQRSTDDFTSSQANQTNLAVKGIIAISAFAQIASRTGNDGSYYSKTAQSYIAQWEQLGFANGHALLDYGDTASHVLLYNLYADKELNLGLIPQSIYDAQSNYYPGLFNEYGVPLDTRGPETKVDWEMFTAAVSSSTTRQMFIDNIANWLNSTSNNQPFSDIWNSSDGGLFEFFWFKNRPVVGGVFSLLTPEHS